MQFRLSKGGVNIVNIGVVPSNTSPTRSPTRTPTPTPVSKSPKPSPSKPATPSASPNPLLKVRLSLLMSRLRGSLPMMGLIVRGIAPRVGLFGLRGDSALLPCHPLRQCQWPTGIAISC